MRLGSESPPREGQTRPQLQVTDRADLRERTPADLEDLLGDPRENHLRCTRQYRLRYAATTLAFAARWNLRAAQAA